jgi:hypothetical protein
MANTQIDGHRQLKFGGDLDLQTHQIHNVVDPTSPQDAATKAYVDSGVADAAGEVTYSLIIENETPTGTINGANVTFTLANTPHANSFVKLYLNGLRLQQGASNDYTVSGATITFNTAPVTNDVLLCDYVK